MHRAFVVLLVCCLLAGCGAVTAGLQFETPGEALWPAEVSSIVRARRLTAFEEAVTVGEHTWLIVGAGERRTGGYRVEFLSVTETPDGLLVRAKVVSPPPGAIVTQALTFPVGVARIPATDRPVVFEVKDQ